METISRPDFVITGWRERDGLYRVLGSTELRDVTVDIARTLHDYAFKPWEYDDAPVTYVMKCRFGSCVIAQGASYAEALQALFRSWSPDGAPDRGLPAATAPDPKVARIERQRGGLVPATKEQQ